jgi:hypothetical protein
VEEQPLWRARVDAIRKRMRQRRYWTNRQRSPRGGSTQSLQNIQIYRNLGLGKETVKKRGLAVQYDYAGFGSNYSSGGMMAEADARMTGGGNSGERVPCNRPAGLALIHSIMLATIDMCNSRILLVCVCSTHVCLHMSSPSRQPTAAGACAVGLPRSS